jgi:hypothetical protein
MTIMDLKKREVQKLETPKNKAMCNTQDNLKTTN